MNKKNVVLLLHAPLNICLHLLTWCLRSIYARLTTLMSSISVLRSMVPVCRDGIMSLSCFLMDPKTGSLILT